MLDDKTISGNYSTGNFTHDHMQTGELAQFAKLEQTMGIQSPSSDEGVIAGKYRLDKVIGQGGMGKIYLATQLKLNRCVAIKVMLAPDDMEATLRFEAEASVTANLTHPNTVRIFDFGVMESGFLYLVMEHLDGINIKEYLKTKGAFEPLLAAKLISEVCGALLEAHQKAIVHRDIKPGNIMLVHMPEGGLRSKLLDFGLVKSLEGSKNRTRTGIVLGSPMYMSPEQIEAQPVSPASDLYSLGLTLYNMLTNARPFLEDSLTGILSAHLLRYPKPIWEVMPEMTHYPGLIWIVNTALQKNPHDRFRSAGQMKTALDCFIQNPKCGFIYEDGELQVTERFQYEEDSGAKESKLNVQSEKKEKTKQSKDKFKFWMSGVAGAGVLGAGLIFGLLQEASEKIDLSEKEAVQEIKMEEVVELVKQEKKEPDPPKKEVKNENPSIKKPKPQKPAVKPKESKTEEKTAVKTVIPPKPSMKKLKITMESGVEQLKSITAICGSYSKRKMMKGSSLTFAEIPAETCELRFFLMSASNLVAKNIPVGSTTCSLSSSTVRCN